MLIWVFWYKVHWYKTVKCRLEQGMERHQPESILQSRWFLQATRKSWRPSLAQRHDWPMFLSISGRPRKVVRKLNRRSLYSQFRPRNFRRVWKDLRRLEGDWRPLPQDSCDALSAIELASVRSTPASLCWSACPSPGSTEAPSSVMTSADGTWRTRLGSLAARQTSASSSRDGLGKVSSFEGLDPSSGCLSPSRRSQTPERSTFAQQF